MRVYVSGVSVLGPGLSGWAGSRPILADETAYVPADPVLPALALLPANERRRAAATTRWALGVAGQAVAMSGLAPETLRILFATANGDGATVKAILEAMTSADPMVSPTQFHNSVHNAAAGYWTIGVKSRQAASCLGCHDETAPAALLKAGAEVAAERRALLLCLYDLPLPQPLHPHYPIDAPFAAALVLTPEPAAGSLASLDIGWRPASSAASPLPAASAFAALYHANPCARILPLLQRLARDAPGHCALPYLDGVLHIAVEPGNRSFE